MWRPRPADSMRESVSERVVASTTSIPFSNYDGGDGVWRPRPDSGNASKCERVKESKRVTTTSTTRVPFINYKAAGERDMCSVFVLTDSTWLGILTWREKFLCSHCGSPLCTVLPPASNPFLPGLIFFTYRVGPSKKYNYPVKPVKPQ